VTSTPPPQPQPGHPVAPVIRPLRDLAAYALVAAPAIWLFVAIVRLVPSEVGQDFLTRVQNSFYGYVNLETIAMPLAAVLLATMVEPRHRHARLITVVALVEYAVAGFFAVVFGFLIAVVKLAGFSVRVAFEEFLVRAAWLAVFAIAAYAVFAIWRSLFATPKPQPGMYGQPQQPWGQQPQWGQPGFPPPAPGYAQPGQPGHPGHAGQAGQPYSGQGGYAGQPGQPAQPGQAPAWGQPPAWGAPPPAPPASAPPASAPPAFGPPASPATPPASAPPAPPVSAQPASGGAPATPPGPFAPAPGNPHAVAHPGSPAPFSEPTQVFPAREDDDRTRNLGEEPPR
jgi:hypothetical protein